jgi:transcriptional regulator with XRE-family HTH domain
MALVDHVAHNLHRVRLRKNFSQREVADKAGVSVSYVSMLERGNRSPPLETIEVLAKALGVAPLSLFEPIESRARR